MVAYKCALSMIHKTLTEWAGRGNQSQCEVARRGSSFGVKQVLWHCSTLSHLKGTQQYLSHNVMMWRDFERDRGRQTPCDKETKVFNQNFWSRWVVLVDWEDCWRIKSWIIAELHLKKARLGRTNLQAKKEEKKKSETLIKSSPARFYLNPEALQVSGQYHHDYWPLYLMRLSPSDCKHPSLS